MITSKENWDAINTLNKKLIAKQLKQIKLNELKEAKSFQKERKKQMSLASKIINPSINYDKEYDMLYLWFGGKNKVESTVELSPDLRVDISKKGVIVAIEICSFSKYQKRNSFK